MKTRIVLIGLFAAAIGLSAAYEGRAQRRIMPSPISAVTRDSTIIYSQLHIPTDTSVARFPLDGSGPIFLPYSAK